MSSRLVELHDPNLGLGSERNSGGDGYGILIFGGFGIGNQDATVIKLLRDSGAIILGKLESQLFDYGTELIYISLTAFGREL